MASLTRGRMGYLLTNFTKVLTKPTSNFYKTHQNLFHCSSFLSALGQEVKMPSLSPTMVEGKIVKWCKKEGDTISPGDVLCDIETDKAIVSMESDEEGILAKILVQENSSLIKVGSTIAVMVSEGEDWKNVEIPSDLQAKSDSSSSSSSSSGSDSNGDDTTSSGPTTYLVNMPSLSPTMTEGTIVKWLKAEGETIAPGDVLCDIQTDKAVMSLEAEEEGILAKILAPDDSKGVKVGTLIALIVPEGEDWKSVTVPGPKSSAVKADIPKSQPRGSSGPGDSREKIYGPAVKALLSTYQLDAAAIKPTGRNNRLLKEDVMKYIEDNKLVKKPPKPVSTASAQPKSDKAKPKSVPQKRPAGSASKYVDVKLSDEQQLRGRRSAELKFNIPHCYSMINCNLDKLMEMQESVSAEGVVLNDLLTKAVALALQIYPKANSMYIDNEIRISRDVDICILTQGVSGWFSPVVKSANLKTVTAISQEIKEMVEKSENLKGKEPQPGSFMISNLGVFGVTHFKPIFNSPQCGILAVGAAVERFDSDLKVQKQVTLTLAYDRRTMEDHEAHEFMDAVKYLIENPKLILSEAKRKAAEMNL